MSTVARVMTEAEQRAAVVAEARSWIGTPYHHRGRVKGAGVDCGQILAAVYEAAGVVPHVDPGAYPHDWHLHRDGERYRDIVAGYAEPTDEPRPGDIALFKWGRCLSHGAIVTAWPFVVHSFVGIGVVEENAEANLELRERFAGFWTPWRKEA